MGVLFLVSFGSLFIGDATIESILDEPDYLINVSENKTQLIIEMFIAFFLASTIVGIAVMMFPILKKHNEPIALGYVGFRITEFAIIIVYLTIQAVDFFVCRSPSS